MNKEIQFLVGQIKNNKQISFVKSNKIPKKVNFKLRAKQNVEDDTESEMEQEEQANEQTADLSDAKMDKRAINYQISKNKGLTPKRNKMYRNPRVRNRIKASKAIIKRKSIVPKVRTQEKRYSGEATGIRMGVVRSAKIK